MEDNAMLTLRVRLHRDLADYHDTAIVRFTSEDALWQSLIAGNIMFAQADEDETAEGLADHIEEQGREVCDYLGPYPMQSIDDCDEYLVSVDGEVENFIEEYVGNEEELSYFLLRGFFLLFAVNDLLGRNPDATLSIAGRQIPLQQIFKPEHLTARLSS